MSHQCRADENDRHHQAEAEDAEDLGRHDRLERVVDPPAEQHGHDDGHEACIRQSHHERTVGLAGGPVQPERGEHRAGVRGEARNHRADVQHEEERGPEARAGPQPHEAGEHGLAAIQGVAPAFQVVKELHDDGHGGDPEQAAAVARGDLGTEQPFAAADLHAHHHDPRPDEPGPVPPGQRRGLGKVVDLPGWQAGRDWRGVVPIGHRRRLRGVEGESL